MTGYGKIKNVSTEPLTHSRPRPHSLSLEDTELDAGAATASASVAAADTTVRPAVGKAASPTVRSGGYARFEDVQEDGGLSKPGSSYQRPLYRRPWFLVLMGMIFVVVLAVALTLGLYFGLTADQSEAPEATLSTALDQMLLFRQAGNSRDLVLSAETLSGDASRLWELLLAVTGLDELDELVLRDVIVWIVDPLRNDTALTQLDLDKALQNAAGNVAELLLPPGTTEFMVTGNLTLFDLVDIDAVAKFAFNADESNFRRADMQFLLELEVELDWNTTGTLPAFRDLPSDSWLHSIDVEARLVVSFSSFVTASLLSGFEAEPGTNVFVDNIAIQAGSTFRNLQHLLSSAFQDLDIALRVVLPVSNPLEEGLVDLYFRADELQLGGLDINSTVLRFIVSGFGSEPLVEVTADLLVDLGFLNPNLTLTVDGDYNSKSQVLKVAGDLSPWDAPFGLEWIRLNDLDVLCEMTRFRTSIVMETDATLTIPGARSRDFSVLLALVDGDLAMSGSGLELNSLSSLLWELISPDLPDIDALFPTSEQSRKQASFAISAARHLIPLPIDHPFYGLTVSRGLTLLLPDVSVGDIIKPVEQYFENQQFGQFSLGAGLPIFDLDQLADFGDTFEVFLRTDGFNITDEFRMVTFEIEIMPLAQPISLGVGCEFELFLPGNRGMPLRFLIEGRLEPPSLVLAGGMLGFWYDAFNVPGLVIGNAVLEVGLTAGPAITSLGVGAEIQFGDHASVMFLGRINLQNYARSFVQAEARRLSLGAIVDFFEDVNDANYGFLQLGGISDAVRFEELSILLAPEAGELAGIPYEKGMYFDCNAVIFAIHVTASLNTEDTALAVNGVDVPLTDIAMAFGFSINGDVFDILEGFIESVLPVDVPSVSGLLDEIGIPLGDLLEEVFSIRRLAIDDFSLLGIFKGDFPDFVAEVVIAGNEKTLRLSVDLDRLGENLGDMLSNSNVADEDDFARCLVNDHCGDPALPLCNHSPPFLCVAACPADTLLVEGAGCFPSSKVKRMPKRSVLDRPLVTSEQLVRFRERQARYQPRTYHFRIEETATTSAESFSSLSSSSQFVYE